MAQKIGTDKNSPNYQHTNTMFQSCLFIFQRFMNLLINASVKINASKALSLYFFYYFLTLLNLFCNDRHRFKQVYIRYFCNYLTFLSAKLTAYL
jgi:hypothetical protein